MRGFLAELERGQADLLRRLDRVSVAVQEVVAEARSLANRVADLDEFVATLESAPPLRLNPDLAPLSRKELDVSGPLEQLTLDGIPLTWTHGDLKARPLTLGTAGGRLLVDLVRAADLSQAWEPPELTRAIQQVRRSPELGRECLAGRGGAVRLMIAMRASTALMRWESATRAAGRARRPQGSGP